MSARAHWARLEGLIGASGLGLADLMKYHPAFVHRSKVSSLRDKYKLFNHKGMP